MLRCGDVYLYLLSLVQVLAYHLLDTKLLPAPTMTYTQFDPKNKSSVKFESNYKSILSRTCIWKCYQKNVDHFTEAAICKFSTILYLYVNKIYDVTVKGIQCQTCVIQLEVYH